MAERTPAARRGHLEVRPRVVDRVAALAAREVAGVVRTPAGRLGRGALPAVHSRVDGDRVRLEVDLAVRWGRSLADVAAGVQERVADRVAALTSLHVELVDVTVEEVLVPAPETSRRVT
ncbi:Asp23/Gls24 family envelope stress response protein [Aquipuribacter nitratireducens]|uniref:Asp23/Gls24 family envelope stress response protein n=1 Tax=Aquipuribacter nitratireducens TaxID=650104 RepID=A0ABW0GUV4_9MICO